LTGRPGVDVPDSRGRTGLDQIGRGLDRNPDVKVVDVELVGSAWHVLRRTTFDYRHGDGRWSREQRETYDRGNGATILLYDPERSTVLLTRQFRYPVYVNGHPDGMLDDDSPRSRVNGGGGIAQEGEDIDVLELPFATALAMTRTGEIADAKTIMLLQWAALTGPFRP
jgi:hypothetical protein